MGKPADAIEADSIYRIMRNSPQLTWEERDKVEEAEVEAALGAYVPGGSSVLAWLPMADGHHIHQTARDVMRAAIAAVDRRRATEAQRVAHGLGKHAQTFEDRGEDGFAPVSVLCGGCVYIQQGGNQITMSPDVAERLAASITQGQPA